jgi:hypothetical protein
MPPNVVEHDSRPPPYLSRDLTALLNKSQFGSLSVSRFVHNSPSRDRTIYLLTLDAVANGFRYQLRSSPEVEKHIASLSSREYAALERKRDFHVKEALPTMLREIGQILERALYVEVGPVTITDNRDERKPVDDPHVWAYDRYDNSFWATSSYELRETGRTRPVGDALSWILRGRPDLANGQMDIFFQTDERTASGAKEIPGLTAHRIEKSPDDLTVYTARG